MPSRFWAWAAESEGSTRTAALLRIGLALIAWARFGHEIAVFHEPSWPRMVLAAAFGLTITAMFVGLWTRVSTIAAAALISVLWWNLKFRHGEQGGHHVYLLASAMWLVALMPAGRSLSIDRWRALRRGTALPERANLWPLRLLAIQMSVVYFWAAFDKTEWGYFTGERMQMMYLTAYAGARFPYDLPWFPAACISAAWGTVLIEYGLAVGLHIPRLRPWLILVGIAFHGIIYLTLSVFTFSVTMILLYLAFIDPDELHRRIDEMLGWPAKT